MNASFATVMQVLGAHNYAIMLPWGVRTEATYYGSDDATFAIGDRVFCEWAAGSNLWTISGELWAISSRNRGGTMHDPVTLGAGNASELTLVGQQLTLANVLTPAEHTAIGDSAPHHAAVTIGADAEHSLAAQVLSGVDAAAAQKGHVQLAGELGGTAAAPTVNATHSGSAHHAVVTLAADAEVLLGLTGQELTLDTQAANVVLAGPASGAAADPTFRALVAKDMPVAPELLVVLYNQWYGRLTHLNPGTTFTAFISGAGESAVIVAGFDSTNIPWNRARLWGNLQGNESGTKGIKITLNGTVVGATVTLYGGSFDSGWVSFTAYAGLEQDDYIQVYGCSATDDVSTIRLFLQLRYVAP